VSHEALEGRVTNEEVGCDARLRAALRTDLQTFLHNSRFLITVGNLSAAILFVVLSGDVVEPLALWLWLAAMALMAAPVSQFLHRTGRMLHPTEPQVSRAAIAVHMAAGFLWGALPWLPLQHDVDGQHWVVLTFLFAISAGAVSGINGMTPLSSAVLVPMWTPAAVAFALDRQPALVTGSIVFVAIVVNDSRTTGRLLHELVRLRVSSGEAADRAAWEATHDPLTGLPNRLGLQERVQAESTDGVPPFVTAMFVDLDHFKEVNDRFGHLVGDTLLVQVADRLRRTVRNGDVVGRLGGDEFLIVMLREMSDELSSTIAHRLIAELEEPFLVDGEEVYVSASVGVARLGHTDTLDGLDVARLVQESDKALYEAKRNGRRRAVLFDAELRDRLSERSGLEMAFRRAVRSDEIEAWGQPVYDLRTGDVAWVELLARWEPTPGSFVPPSLFVPLAEEIGVIDDLGRRMLGHATQALSRWQHHPVLQHAAVGVNISALQVLRDDLLEAVSELVACEGLAAHRLVLELTESQQLDVQRAATTLHRLAELGVRLAVDDFGSGYSSLGQLLTLPVSIVKIDRSLTSGCEQDVQRTELVRAIHQLAASLGHVVVAEGVETQGERDTVARLGLDQAQGYLFCPPLPLHGLEEQLQRERSIPAALPARQPAPHSEPGQPHRLPPVTAN
jgi:diguanylate cyclase (GGDEF)-like protein